jgi:acetolactate synthase-1/2/3 large subunit
VGLHFDLDEDQFLISGINDIVLDAGFPVVRHAPTQRRVAFFASGAYQQQLAVRLRHYHIVPLMLVPRGFRTRREAVFSNPDTVIVYVYGSVRFRTLRLARHPPLPFTRHSKQHSDRTMKAGDLLVQTLIAHGIDTTFTVPGESFLTVLEALRRMRNQIRLISVRQEGGGGFMAEAFGKLTGRPAALFVSRGPGATNASIAVHTARQDSTPMLLFIGQVRRQSKGREAFQEIDHHAMFGTVAKAVLEPETPEQVGEVTARAIALSQSGRPGPVVVVLPRDVTEADITDVAVAAPEVAVNKKIDTSTAQRVADLINGAQRPLAIVGEQAAHEAAADLIADFAQRSGVPVMAAYRRQDTIDNLHPGYAGHLEINRVPYQREALDSADLIVALGSRLDGITGEEGAVVSGRLLVMLHPDPAIVERHDCEAALIAGVKDGLDALLPLLDPADESRRQRQNDLHAAYLQLSEPGGVQIRGNVDLAAVTAAIQAAVPDDAVIVTDGGSFARWIHRYYRFRAPRTQAGPMSGAMGYAVPGAIGARLARPGVPVVALVGDGGFMMSGQELATGVEEKLPLVIVVCDNAAHGSILQGQLGAYGAGHEYATHMQGPDFAALARAYGAPAWRVERTEEFPAIFAQALAVEGPALIHLITDRRDIVPYGAGKEAV